MIPDSITGQRFHGDITKGTVPQELIVGPSSYLDRDKKMKKITKKKKKKLLGELFSHFAGVHSQVRDDINRKLCRSEFLYDMGALISSSLLSFFLLPSYSATCHLDNSRPPTTAAAAAALRAS